MPERAGALRVELSMVDGSILPRDGYTRIAVTDAEASRGWGAQLTARDARERIRVSTGIARSRFVNPVDPLLAGDTTAVAVDPTARAARYGELAVQLPADQKIAGRLPVALSATIRHERVDPLYRSVGASVASDVAQDGLDIAARIGALALQAAATSGRDNLADIPSVLTSHTASRSVQGSLSIADLSRMPDAWFLPSFQYALQHTHQNGTGVPANGDFSDTHVPDQLSTVRSASVSWSAAAMNLVYRWNASFQDNRQPGRERADFRGEVHAVTLGTTLLRMMSASVEGSVERQSTLESGLTQRTARLGASSEFRLGSATVLSTAFSRAHSSDPFANRTMRNTELHAELSRGFNLYRRKAGATQGRTFLRYARTTAVLVAPSDPSNALTWTLNAGGSIRLY
jgi:hypothetical protein